MPRPMREDFGYRFSPLKNPQMNPADFFKSEAVPNFKNKKAQIFQFGPYSDFKL
jgi:hypothetical protein